MAELTNDQLSRLEKEYWRVVDALMMRDAMLAKAIETWGENPTALGPKTIVENARKERDRAEKAYNEIVAQLG